MEVLLTEGASKCWVAPGSRWRRRERVAEKKMNRIHLPPPAGVCTNEDARGGFQGSAPALISAPEFHRASKVTARLSLKMNCEVAAPATYLNGALDRYCQRDVSVTITMTSHFA